jgi:hypothetical protein
MLILKFSAGLILLFGIAAFIGHLLKLDSYLSNEPEKHLKKI